jgi:hypothetical protein
MFAAANLVIERTNAKNCLFLYVYLTSTNEENIKKIKAQINLAFLSFFRNFAIRDGEVTKLGIKNK